MSYFIIAFILILLAFGLGPRLTIKAQVKVPDLPPDLDAYLVQTQAHIPTLVSGTEKSIVWYEGHVGEQTDLAIVYLHGFSASRQEIVPTCDLLASRLGANLFYTRLVGHGSDGAAMAEITLEGLLSDAVEAFEIGKRIGRQVILIGNSTGATLATWLAVYQKHPAIHSVVLMSPNFGLHRRTELLLLPWGKHILHLLQGKEYQFTPANPQQAKYWTTRYPSQALLPMMALIKLVRDSRLEQIHCPLLMLYSPRDNVVNVRRLLTAFTRMGSEDKRLIEIHNGGARNHHVLAGDILSPQTTEQVVGHLYNFITKS